MVKNMVGVNLSGTMEPHMREILIKGFSMTKEPSLIQKKTTLIVDSTVMISDMVKGWSKRNVRSTKDSSLRIRDVGKVCSLSTGTRIGERLSAVMKECSKTIVRTVRAHLQIILQVRL